MEFAILMGGQLDGSFFGRRQRGEDICLDDNGIFSERTLPRPHDLTIDNNYISKCVAKRPQLCDLTGVRDRAPILIAGNVFVINRQ